MRAADGPPEADDEGGRGLLLVAAPADKWGVAERNPGKVVWCEFGVVAQAPPAHRPVLVRPGDSRRLNQVVRPARPALPCWFAALFVFLSRVVVSPAVPLSARGGTVTVDA
ncbi:hypothetical protein GA0115253_1079714 [Streptomyces sp. Termitarium-T10T-6]|nr:hypothetical protein GA0115253_1079714 [Streptomyces sp. Termitarium-T10T-6]